MSEGPKKMTEQEEREFRARRQFNAFPASGEQALALLATIDSLRLSLDAKDALLRECRRRMVLCDMGGGKCLCFGHELAARIDANLAGKGE